MNDILEISQDGFSLSAVERQLADVALLSLRIGLKAYFSTYKTLKGRLSIIDSPPQGRADEESQAIVDYYHNPDYCEAYSEVILHFHHFIELTIKELLRREHDLLAVDASNKPVILHKLLMREEVADSDIEGLKSPEFSEALDRLLELIKKKRITDYNRLKFIVVAKPWLKELNILRNRLVHRGTYILRYKALDRLVGKYIFPFLQKAITLPIYTDSEFQWQYRKLNCRTDPIVKIIQEANNTKINSCRIFLLKELGRAAYENPLRHGPLRKQRGLRIVDGIEQDAEKIAKGERGKREAVEIRVCPVCGVKALAVYGTIRSDSHFDEEEGKEYSIRDEFYTYAAKCMCCSFEIEDELENSAFAGLPIRRYWRVEELLPITEQNTGGSG